MKDYVVNLVREANQGMRGVLDKQDQQDLEVELVQLVLGEDLG